MYVPSGGLSNAGARPGILRYNAPALFRPPTAGGLTILQHLNDIRQHLLRHRRLFGIGIAALIAADVAGLAIPWLTKNAIDALLRLSESGLALLRYPALIVLVACGQGAFRYLWRTHIFGYSRSVEYDFRNVIFGHLQHLPLSYFQKTKTGDLMSRLTNDMTSFRELIGFGVVATIDSLVMITTSLTLMIVIDPRLALWALLPLTAITALVLRYGNRIHAGYREVQQQLSTLSTFVQENLSGIRVVHAYAQEENQLRRFGDLSRDYLRKNLTLVRLWGLFWPLLGLCSGLAAMIVLWLGGRRVLEGQLSLGQFVAFNGYLALLTWPVMAVGYVVNMYQRGSSALERIVEILKVPPAPGYLRPPAGPPPDIRGEITIGDLTFQYEPDGPTVLRDITLHVPAGTSLGIVGEIGSGKSTLVHLLARLYEPPPGTILLDGRDVTTIPLSALKAAIGLVPQDIFLFADTIRENILFGRADATPEEVEEAARIAQLMPNIREFARQFETLLGERGVKLSGGQKQRTALARAIVKNPPILILDDAFSSVDTQTEEAILAHLRRFMRGRTTLLISHRVSTIKDADQIAVMRGGRLVELGAHRDLLARGGLYAALWRRQQLAREIGALAEDGEPIPAGPGAAPRGAR